MKNRLDLEYFNEFCKWKKKKRKKKQTRVEIPRFLLFPYDILKWKSNGPSGMNSHDVFKWYLSAT